MDLGSYEKHKNLIDDHLYFYKIHDGKCYIDNGLYIKLYDYIDPYVIFHVVCDLNQVPDVINKRFNEIFIKNQKLTWCYMIYKFDIVYSSDMLEDFIDLKRYYDKFRYQIEIIDKKYYVLYLTDDIKKEISYYGKIHIIDTSIPKFSNYFYDIKMIFI